MGAQWHIQYTMTQQNKTYFWWWPLVAGLVIATSWLAIDHFVIQPDRQYFTSVDKDLYLEQKTYSEVSHLVQNRYYRRVDATPNGDMSISSIIDDLDPFSRYFDPEENRIIGQEMEGNYRGIGIHFFEHPQDIAVLYVKKGSPADTAGIKVGDIIIGADGFYIDSVLTAETLSGIVRSQPSDTPLLLTVDRYPSPEPVTISVRPAEVALDNVSVRRIIQDTIAYIKLDRFGPDAYRDFMEAVEQMFEYGNAHHLIIDLRQNGGGLLKEAVNMLSQFFKEKGKLLVYTEGKNRKRSEYFTTGKNFYDIEKMAVIIDGSSASASEIVAGAIQDLDRGLVIGTPSYGKGLVQEHFNLSDGSGIRLTVAGYYLPSGRSIQKPDSEDDYDIVVFKTARGRTVYGSGGISPDIPLTDTIAREDMATLLPNINALAFDWFRSGLSPEEVLDASNSAALDASYRSILADTLQSDLELLTPGLMAWAEPYLVRLFMQLHLDDEAFFDWQMAHDTAIHLAIENLFNTALLRPQ